MYPYFHYVNTPYEPVYVHNRPIVLHQSNYYPNQIPFPYYQIRNYPQVNPAMLMKSANKMQTLVQDAMLVLGKISASKQFAIDLMSAAQQSNKKKVADLIRSTGVRYLPETTYSPVGLHLKFSGDVEKIDCCHLVIDLRWE